MNNTLVIKLALNGYAKKEIVYRFFLFAVELLYHTQQFNDATPVAGVFDKRVLLVDVRET